MPFNEKSLANLKKFQPGEHAKAAQRKSVESRLLNKEFHDRFIRDSKAFSKVLETVPNLSSLDVMRMCIHMALQDNNYEDAARWAKELAEYEKPKLQRVEQIVREDMSELTEEELIQKAKDEGLL